MPYDTNQEVISVAGDNPGTLEEHLINFSYTPLLDNGKVDYKRAKEDLQKDSSIKMAAIQRSRGYSSRDSFVVSERAEMIKFVKKYATHTIINNDSFYDEMTK